MLYNPSKRKRLDYGPKKYKDNPLFRKKGTVGPGIKGSFKIAKIIAALLLLSLAGLGWFALFSEYFSVSDIEIIGQGSIDPSAVRSSLDEQLNMKIMNILPRKNYFILDKAELARMLNDKYNFGLLNIEKRPPRSLIVEYKQRDCKYIWNEQAEYYYIDSLGYLIEKTEPDVTGTAAYRLISNSGNPRIKDNKVGLDEQIYPQIDAVGQLLADKYRGIPPVERIIIADDENSFKLKIKDGPEVIINLRDDLAGQLAKLELLITEKLKGGFMNKSYIDIRFGDMIYYQ